MIQSVLLFQLNQLTTPCSSHLQHVPILDRTASTPSSTGPLLYGIALVVMMLFRPEGALPEPAPPARAAHRRGAGTGAR